MVSSQLLKEFGFKEEKAEVVGTIGKQFFLTGYPEPKYRFHIGYEVPDMSLEEPYYWVLDNLKEGFNYIEKIEDAFSASENSAFFGVTQQRLGAQQDKIGQYLATIGKMVKELFQMVRELRILDERLNYYGGAAKEIEKEKGARKKSDEITLKGIFVDLVQGGGKSPASVYGMARELEFVTLPDLFFDAPPFKNKDEMENYVDGLAATFNFNVLRVLKRHLRQFMEWKKRTHSEHQTRKDFLLKYLKQHYDIIQMYITWIKPYLKTVRRLSLKGAHQDSADLITSFEGSMMDIELLAHNPGWSGCLLITMNYRTRPHMKFVQEGYQRGPVHVGKLDLYVRNYHWTKKQIQKYKEMKDKEALDLIGDVSASVQESMKALGDELEKYLLEARAIVKKEEKKKKETEPEKSIFENLLGIKPKKVKVKKQASKKELKVDPGLPARAWGVYHYFKKSHRMVTW